jgi:RimJ/RimL family protein N-acetyltransferase
LKAGTILNKFKSKGGHNVTLRTPSWRDLDDLLEFINSLVEEDAMIGRDSKVTRDEEVDWLAERLKNLEKDRNAQIVAEVDGVVIGSCELSPGGGRMRHVGSLGISILKGYRNLGIGQEMMKELEKHADNLGIKIITLQVFSINERAIHVYRKMGFNEVGIIQRGIRYEGKLVDNTIMVKHLYTIST